MQRNALRFQLCFLLIKYFLVECLILVCDDGRADCVTGDVDRSTRHIQNTVATHNKADAFDGQADRG